MPPLIVWFFLLFATLFAGVHRAAVAASLYWYYSWFDIVMHFWGGLLVSLGMLALSTMKVFYIKPTPKSIVVVLVAVMIGWEAFEFSVGLYDAETYVSSALKDIFFGSLGAVSGYFIFIKRKIV